MKIVFVQGKSKTGKTTTLHMLIKLFLSKGATIISPPEKRPKKDIWVIMSFENLKIGISTSGDFKYIVENAIEYFNKENCDIVFCASRTKGDVIDYVESLKTKYEVYVVGKANTWDIKIQTVIDEQMTDTLYKVYEIVK